MLTVGEILKKERERQGLTHEDIEKKLKIRKQYLRAVEAGDWSVFTSKIYIIGVIKNYAKLLGLPHDKVLAFFRREYERTEELAFKKRVSQKQFTSQTRFAIIAGIMSVAILVISYFGYQVKALLTPPKVEITAPIEDHFARVTTVTVKGMAQKESEITIFGNHIYQDKDGSFQYDLPLKLGKNTLVVDVVGPNGKRTRVEKIYYLDKK